MIDFPIILPDFDPVLISFGFIQIRYYSLAYIFAILIGWFLSKKTFISDDKIREKFDDFITYLIL